MDLYVYLNEMSHVEAWTVGGEIPIKPSSSYFNAERKGTSTPDENITHKSNVDARKYGFDLQASGGGMISGVHVVGSRDKNGPIPDIHIQEYSHSDGLVLCFCAVLDAEVATKFENKKACVRIKDIEALKRCIDAQIGFVSKADWCTYTGDHNRDHFLKSDEDSWQQEYRLFWSRNDAKEIWVLLPPGVGELVATY